MAARDDVPRGSRGSRLVLLLLLAAGWWFLAPPQAGGTMSYVVTSERASSTDAAPGGLLLLREHTRYRVGDVVANRNGPTGTLEMGRITSRDGDRFVVHQDGTRFANGYHPTRADIVGSPWLYVPGVATVAGVPLAPAVLAPALVLALLTLLLALFLPRGASRRAGLSPVSRPATPLGTRVGRRRDVAPT